MKIVHILLTHSFAGTERYVVELANAQVQTGHEVTVILHKRGAEPRPNAIAHRFDAQIRKEFVSGPSFWAAAMARRRLKQLSAEVAHAHLSAACRALHGLKGGPLRVATLHIHYKPQQHRDMDALIAIAPWQLQGVPAEQRNSAAQINNWTQALPPQAGARERIRADLGVGPDDYLVGALCRVEASKGLDVLVDAFAASRPAGMRLAIVGGGRDWAALRQRAAPDVMMPGFVERPQDWFAAFDLFVSSARSEPFGLVFLEAFAAGLPVLATASEGAKQFAPLIDRPLLACGDVGAMSQALQDLSRQRPARRVVDLSAYSYASQVAKVETFYRGQLGLA